MPASFLPTGKLPAVDAASPRGVPTFRLSLGESPRSIVLISLVFFSYVVDAVAGRDEKGRHHEQTIKRQSYDVQVRVTSTVMHTVHGIIDSDHNGCYQGLLPYETHVGMALIACIVERQSTGIES